MVSAELTGHYQGRVVSSWPPGCNLLDTTSLDVRTRYGGEGIASRDFWKKEGFWRFRAKHKVTAMLTLQTLGLVMLGQHRGLILTHYGVIVMVAGIRHRYIAGLMPACHVNLHTEPTRRACIVPQRFFGMKIAKQWPQSTVCYTCLRPPLTLSVRELK